MLFAQRNGLAHALGDSEEVDVLQNLACGIGPHVDGIAASRSIPQAMGAFVTAGAQGMCGGRDQQTEQHTPTTGYGLGADAAIAPTMIKLPTTFTSKIALVKAAAFAPDIRAVAATRELAPLAPEAPQAPSPPSAPVAVIYPPGTITAFSAKTNQWRIAVPPTTAGLGIFSAAGDFVEVAPTAAPPPGATQVPEKDLLAKTGKLPFFKKPLFWVAVAGGAVVIGGGSYFLLRRRKHS